MKRKAYGRDAGLTLRMLFTGFLLGLLYVFFALVLFYVLNAGLVLMLVIVGRAGALPVLHLRQARPARRPARRWSSADEAPELHDMIERLCALADLREAAGRDHRDRRPERVRHRAQPEARRRRRHEGLWNRLEPQEIEGVLAHELSHIANRDVLVMTLASFFAMLAGLLTRFGLYAGMFGGGGNRDNNNSGARSG